MPAQTKHAYQRFFIRRFFSFAAVLMLSMMITACSTTKNSYYVDDNYNTGKRMFETGRYQEAIDYYKAFMAENPDSPLNEIVLYYLGKSHQELGNAQQAIETYEILINRYQADFWVNLAQEEMKLIKARL